jgi:hypothetical protein
MKRERLDKERELKYMCIEDNRSKELEKFLAPKDSKKFNLIILKEKA